MWRSAAGAAFTRDRKGSAAIEGAIILPVLILAAVGGCDVGLAVLHKGQLIYATQEAARTAAAGGDYAALFRSNMGPDGSQVTCSGSQCDGTVTHNMIAGGLIGYDTIPMAVHAAAAVLK
jgi:hypothetical protein